MAPKNLAPKTTLIALSALAVLAGACTPSETVGGPDVDLNPSRISLTSGLTTASSCGELLAHLKAEGLEQVGPYGFGNGYFGIDIMEGATDDALGEPATTAASQEASAGDDGGRSSDGDFSGTNNQEADVDEPDTVKTDGKRLVLINNQSLEVIDTSGEIPRLDKKIALPENYWGGELFLAGDRAFVMTTGWAETPLNSDMPSRYYPGTQTTQILEVDLESGKTLRTLTFEGSYLSARDSNGVIRIVLSAPIEQNFGFVFPQGESGEERAEKANREVITESTIDQWLPGYRLQEGNNVIAEGRLVDCDRVHIPGEFSGFGSMNILTIDPDKGLEIVDATSVLTTAQTMYASTDRLAIATARPVEFEPRTGEPIRGNDEFRTAIHNFDITQNDRTQYVASGTVPGSMLSQYSLSERDGYLRVATTSGNGWWSEETSESFITVLHESGGELIEVGQVGGLGKGERIFAVRFVEDVAYVVTFRQTDPLYTIDLSNPENPMTLGELKIPGFSNYLHPVGEGYLLGVGQDGTEEGRITGAQVSSFDVSDLTNPRRVDALGIGQGGTNSWSDSPVAWNARAFTWWAPERLAIVPVNWSSWDERTNENADGSDAVLIEVGTNGSLTERGRVSHPGQKQCEGVVYYEDRPEPQPLDAEDAQDPEEELTTTIVAPAPAEIAPGEPVPGEPGQYCWNWQPHISRTVIINGNLYTISDMGVGVNELDGLAKVAFLAFD